MFDRVLNTVLMSIPQCKYNINFQREDQSATKENTKFCGLSVLVCCCAANQDSKIGGIFKNLSENSVRSKV